MRIQRFFLNPAAVNLETGSIHILDPGIINQIRKVLRLRAGNQIIVLTGSGAMHRCVLEQIGAAEIQGRVVETGQAKGDPPVSVTVALPMIKGGRFEWALQKLTELGAGCVIPVMSGRSVVKTAPDRISGGENKIARWQAIVREAAEQCERASLPAVKAPAYFQDLLRPESAAGMKLICSERSDAPLMHGLLHSLEEQRLPRMNILLAVGPEGGFTPEEIAAAERSGAQLVSLGPRILRTETAAIHALSQIMSVLGDG